MFSMFKKKEDAEVKDSEVKTETVEDINFTVPEPETTDTQTPDVKDEHNIFNDILFDKESDKYYRIKSDESKEVFRIKCTGHNYDFCGMGDIHKYFYSYRTYYIKSEDRWHFVTRVFVTKNNKYFFQYVRSDSTVCYQIVDRSEIQRIIMLLENNKESDYNVIFSCNDYRAESVIKPGSYDTNTYKTVFLRNNDRTADSYEIIDKDLYEDIIEVL